ncbi:BMP family ABC transporter substrate-binding protein [Oenococcus sicerae]|uniref:BMP family ABC transporter substrate-binding protein n=1 Tax=Oenococcus sicerae TaxID=2203724 RepID=A0AAJ1VQR2_9LACO|nr:BMP family ABC transporter substrate-binding protein [Oenococcus sicerae]MDN6900532.1 BMP family ABC transporter substrate-binding protein [Oenococcus sicerae]QAS69449.1 BMP family ABC transporter substrate-binding protein [Oenococcus sicerae]VDK14112.1 Membrane lipoprotein TmpC precursor [Oenococcus sicerae]
MNRFRWTIVGIVVVIVAAIGVYLGVNHGKTSSSNNSSKKSVAIITDTGGIDDHSFNQSAWEGLQKYGKQEGLSKGNGGYNYFQSNDESDYKPNINSAVQAKFDTIFGIGYSLENAVKQAAKQNPKINFAIIDDVIPNIKNVVSVTFHTEQSSYLAGVAAAKASKTQKIGFIGGVKGDVIDTFQAGYVAGAKSVNKNIRIDVQYANSFADAAQGKTIASAMYANGDDVIFTAAGGTGNGVFAQAKALNQKQSADKKVWVIGVDRDQKADGSYTDKDGKKANFTLASAVKEVGQSLIDISKKAQAGKFPGGKIVSFGFKQKGVYLAKDSMTASVWSAVQAAQKKVESGSVKVPVHPKSYASVQ